MVCEQCALRPTVAPWRLAGDDNVVRFWQVSSGLKLLDLPALPKQIKRLAFSPDGQRLLAALMDGTIRVYDAPKVENPSPFKP